MDRALIGWTLLPVQLHSGVLAHAAARRLDAAGWRVGESQVVKHDVVSAIELMPGSRAAARLHNKAVRAAPRHSKSPRPSGSVDYLPPVSSLTRPNSSYTFTSASTMIAECTPTQRLTSSSNQ